MGLRLRHLGTKKLTWRELGLIIRNLPRQSAMQRKLLGEEEPWGLAEHLLAAAVDALNGANWQRGNGKRGDRPKPIPRPGISDKVKYGGEAIPLDEMDDWLGWSKELENPEPVRPVDKVTPPRKPRKRDERGRFAK